MPRRRRPGTGVQAEGGGWACRCQNTVRRASGTIGHVCHTCSVRPSRSSRLLVWGHHQRDISGSASRRAADGELLAIGGEVSDDRVRSAPDQALWPPAPVAWDDLLGKRGGCRARRSRG